MVCSDTSYNDHTQVPGYHPDGLNSSQNAAVGIVKTLSVTWFNKPDVLAALPTLQSAIALNDPPLTLDEAEEILHQLYGFYLGYFGGHESQLFDILQSIENLFPEAQLGRQDKETILG